MVNIEQSKYLEYKTKLRKGLILDLDHVYYELSPRHGIIKVRITGFERTLFNTNVSTVSVDFVNVLEKDGYLSIYSGRGIIGQTVFYSDDEPEVICCMCGDYCIDETVDNGDAQICEVFDYETYEEVNYCSPLDKS